MSETSRPSRHVDAASVWLINQNIAAQLIEGNLSTKACLHKAMSAQPNPVRRSKL